MIERIDLILPHRSQYHVMHCFTRYLAEGLGRAGVRCRLLQAHYNRPKEFLDKIFEDPPECTLSFNGLLPDKDGNFFCDLIKIPHVACLVDGPQNFIELTKSPRTIITSIDLHHRDFFLGINFQNVFFMPHGVDKNAFYSAVNHRQYDVLFPASFIDYEEVRKEWQQTYPEVPIEILEETAELFLTNKAISLVEALSQSIDRHAKHSYLDFKKLNILHLMTLLEDYVNGKQRAKLLQNISDAEVHIIGHNSKKWEKYVKSPKAVYHPSVHFEQALHMMRHSKIVINCCPKIKYGTHERTLGALASGALCITESNNFMNQYFSAGQSILYYDPKTGDINALINEYLQNNEKRSTLVEKAQEIAKNGHTWDHRAEQLINDLTPILNKII